MNSDGELVRVREIEWAAGGLRDISFTLAAGEILTLLGPPGAGKTAMLTLLAGLASPDRGELAIDGVPAGAPAHRRGIGVIFAAENLFAHLSVAQNIALPLRARKMTAAARQARVGELLELLRIAPLAARHPAELSALEAGRAALARALAVRPRLLLLDEPLGGCDPAPRASLAADLLRLRGSLGFGAIMATRHAADARTLSDRIAVLVAGTVAQQDSVAELYDRPVSAAVAACMGETNQLPGVLRGIEDDIALVALDCGPVVEAGLADVEMVGARCVVLVRPERLAVAAVSAAELGPGAVPAEIRGLRDMGDHVRLTLGVGGTQIVVRRPAGAALAGLAPGRMVAIAWQAQHAWACRAES